MKGGFSGKYRGLYWRQLSVTAGTVLLTLTLLGASFFSLSYHYAFQQRTEELESKAKTVAALSAPYLNDRASSSEEDFGRLASFAASVSDVDFLICDTQGRVLMTTDQNQSGQEITIPGDLMTKTLEGGRSSERSSLNGLYPQRRFLVGVPVELSGSCVGAVFAVAATTSLDNLWHTFMGLFIMTSLVVLMVAFMAASMTAMRQTQPIREMVQATRRYAEGDFDIRMNDYGRSDEIGELAASFNNMAESLQQTERQRREFIANISHELKTPMTTIAGFMDGMLDGTIPQELYRKYMQKVSDEVRRLSRLVRSMLDISRLQSQGIPESKKSKFDLCESVGSVLITFEQKINAKNLDVQADLPEDPVTVWGDLDSITQVIYNLVDNAVKFCPEKGGLWVRLKTAGGKARVTVGNTGGTIPPDELPLLFDRFHKLDKSRSVDRDGYGLGLYIVKTIIDSHGEDITVTSENGRTEFSFTLPLKK